MTALKEKQKDLRDRRDVSYVFTFKKIFKAPKLVIFVIPRLVL